MKRILEVDRYALEYPAIETIEGQAPKLQAEIAERILVDAFPQFRDQQHVGVLDSDEIDPGLANLFRQPGGDCLVQQGVELDGRYRNGIFLGHSHDFGWSLLLPAQFLKLADNRAVDPHLVEAKLLVLDDV